MGAQNLNFAFNLLTNTEIFSPKSCF